MLLFSITHAYVLIDILINFLILSIENWLGDVTNIVSDDQVGFGIDNLSYLSSKTHHLHY